MTLTITQHCEFDFTRFWCRHYLFSCVTREPEGAYVARFPWRPNPPSLPNNFLVAERRTCQMLKWLAKTPNLLLMYNNIINEQEARGFIEHVEPTDDQTNFHCISHYTAEKDSPMTPIRIVFYCSCRQSSGYPSINDCLLIGSPCVSDLCAILVRFRCHPFKISTDIEKVFFTCPPTPR